MGVDPVGGRCGAGPRGGAAWEERGGRHPRVGGGVRPPSTGYVVVLLSHVSPVTTPSLPPPSLSHRPLSTVLALRPALGLPPLGPAPPSDLAARPRTQAARRGRLLWIAFHTPAEAATAAEAMQQAAEGGE